MSKVSHALRIKKVFDGLCKHIVIPIKRLKYHWFLIIVNVSAESIHVLDSLDNDDDENFLNYRHCVTRYLEDTAKFEKQSSNINWALPAVNIVPAQEDEFSGGLRVMANTWLFVLYGLEGIKYSDNWIRENFASFLTHFISLPHLHKVTDRCVGC